MTELLRNNPEATKMKIAIYIPGGRLMLGRKNVSVNELGAAIAKIRMESVLIQGRYVVEAEIMGGHGELVFAHGIMTLFY